MKKILLFLCIAMLLPDYSFPCTGISLATKKGNKVVARTIEWGGSELNSSCVIVPRGYKKYCIIPANKKGMHVVAKYGYVGLSIENEQFVVEGINEKGLSAGLFYFPGYGGYPDFDAKYSDKSISDLELVSWMLAECGSVQDVISLFEKKDIRVTALDERASTVHWRIADKSGREVVLEIVGGKPYFFENELGVLTNSPGFQWQLTNLSNYVNIMPGTAQENIKKGFVVRSFGAGSLSLGLPGDVTPPSRFVRAAFYKLTAPVMDTSYDTVLQCFQILNNFDIPIGVEFSDEQQIPNIPSATQWTTATDIDNGALYYRTMYNSTIRKIDLKDIDFNRCKYKSFPLDKDKKQPIEVIKI